MPWAIRDDFQTTGEEPPLGAMTENKIGGLALMAGAILMIVMSAIAPGTGFVDPVEEPTDLFAHVDALGDNSRLAHVTTLLTSLAMVLQLSGVVILWRNTGGNRSADSLVRLGLSAIVVAIVFLLASRGMNHMTMHIREHGVGIGAVATSAGSMAVTLQAVKGGLALVASTVGQFGYIVFGRGWPPGSLG